MPPITASTYPVKNNCLYEQHCPFYNGGHSAAITLTVWVDIGAQMNVL